MPSESTPIVIDLFQPDLPYAGSLLQRDALNRLREFVTDRINEIESLGQFEGGVSDLFYPRFHRAVLIKGGRGSGKTTFVLKALNEIRKDSAYGAELCVLPMIDPTLIETKDHIILVILQMIDSAVENACSDASTQDDLDRAREALAGGLALLDGIGPKEAYGGEWEDPSWVMSEGLRKAKKGRLFEQKFNEYIKSALNVLKKKAFVLAFDDVDTNFSCGHMILETIRKYLTTPHLFLVLSGDLDLYGRLVRKDIYATFGSDLMRHDEDIIPVGKNSLSNATIELEEQYLLKVLPPQYRIPMLALGDLKDTVEIRLSKDEDSLSLASWASNQIRTQLREKKSNKHHLFMSVIFAEHLRLVLGYLRGLQLADSDATESRRKVLEVFDTRLRVAGISELFLQRGKFNHTLHTIFEWFTERDEPSALIMFRNLETANESVVLHCLALALADGLKDGGAVLQALFTLALPAAMTKQPILSDKGKPKDMLGFLWRRGEAFLPDVAARITSISRSSDMRGRLRASMFGSVGVAQSKSISSKQSAITRIYGIFNQDHTKDLTVEKLKNQFSSKEKGQDTINVKWLEILEKKHSDLNPRQNVSWFTIEKLLDEERCCAFGPLLNLISFRHYNSSNEIQYSISALSLLAAVGELLALKTVNGEEISKLSLEDVIPNFGQTVDMRADEDTSELGSDISDNDVVANDKTSQSSAFVDDEEKYKVFLENLAQWLNFAHEMKEMTALSPSLLGTLANRMHDDLLDLDESVRGSDMSGQILHRQLTNILNAIVTVTAELPGRRESPKSSDAPFGRALKRTKGETLHPLSAVLLSCPLFWVFLNPEEVFEQGSSSSETIVDTVSRTLCKWYDTFSSEAKRPTTSPEFKKWTQVPQVTVKISNILKNKPSQRFVVIKGFYDLLNVVPRYAETVQSKK